MAEFTPITTQEQFDAAIGERIKRERETISKNYSDYEDLKGKISDYENQVGTLNKHIKEESEKYIGYDKTLEELQSKVKGYETSSVKMRIAQSAGIPYELTDRLSGESEDEIQKDAEVLAKFIGRTQMAAPLRATETTTTDSKKTALRALTEQLTKKENE